VGREQAEHLAAFLKAHGRPEQVAGYDPQNVGGFGLTHLYTSLMVRSVATGTVVARALGLPLVAWPEIHETGGIHWIDPETEERKGLPGKNRAYFAEHYPHLHLPGDLNSEGWWNRPFEEVQQRTERARGFLDDLADRHGGTDDRVAIISHGGFYNHVLRALLDMTPLGELQGHTVYFAMNNTGISRVDFEDGYAHLQYSNHVGHLPPELIT
jgi:2,3-bisphosphoglycerate-dependent phosphoglycerate mutase